MDTPTNNDVSREAQQAFPAYVDTDEKRRRWELAARAVMIAFGYDPDSEDEPLDHSDRMLFIYSIPSAYKNESIPTGEGEITEHQRRVMRARGVL